MDSMSSSQSVEEVERRSIPRLRIAFGLIVLSGVAMLCVLCQQFQGSVDMIEFPVPADFWAELRAEGLIRADAPTPAG